MLRPQNLRDRDRRFGLLSSIQPGEDCQIALIVNRYGERLVVLPQDLDLSEYVGLQIGLTMVGQKYLIRRLA